MKKYLTIALATTLTLLMSACGDKQPTGETQANTNTPTPSKTIRIATESSFKPFSYLDTQGNVVGFEIDLANALCQQMNATCDISSQDWDSLIPSLNAQKFDAVMAGLSVTEERKQVVAFSTPYFNNTLVLVGKKGDNTTINDIDGKQIATQQATVSAQYLEKNHPKAIIKNYDKQDNAYLDLSAGRVDYMLSDIVPMLDWLKSESGQDFEVKGSPIDIDDVVAIALRQNDPLIDDFNHALARLKENGKYDKIVAQYFDTNIINQTKPQ